MKLGQVKFKIKLSEIILELQLYGLDFVITGKTKDLLTSPDLNKILSLSLK